MYNCDLDTPFDVDKPVDPKYFKGRGNIIDKILFFIPKLIKGTPQHYFIRGERGMGKSSIVKYLLFLFKKDYNFTTVHILNDSMHDVDELVTQLVEGILNEINIDSWSDNLKNIFDEYIESVGVKNFNVKFKPNPNNLKIIRDNLPEFLYEITSNFEDDECLIIVIDDINGLSETPEFSNWFKAFIDTLYINKYEYKMPVSFIITGKNENLELLRKHNPSFPRLFKHHELGKLDDSDVKSFYIDIFNKLGVKYNVNALDMMVFYSNGMPVLMQEIGGAVFWFIGNNKYIDVDTVLKGIKMASDNITIKYIPDVENLRIQDNVYSNILIKMAQFVSGSDYGFFSKKDLIENLTDDELSNLDALISICIDLNILEIVDSNFEKYKFTNDLFTSYYLIQTLFI